MRTDEETENKFAGKRYALNVNKLILQQSFGIEMGDRFAVIGYTVFTFFYLYFAYDLIINK